jgi:uncharacterized membrane protein (DUF485 family)
MEEDHIPRIKPNPGYRDLIAARSSFARAMFVSFLSLFAVPFLVSAFHKQWLDVEVADTGITLGVIFGGVIATFNIAAVGIYLSRTGRLRLR